MLRQRLLPAINALCCCQSHGHYTHHRSQINVPDHCYKTLTSRGSGPGGQGVSSSSNCAEIHVDLDMLETLFGSDTINTVRKRNQKNLIWGGEHRRKIMPADLDPLRENNCSSSTLDLPDAPLETVRSGAGEIRPSFLKVTSHQHRSLHANKQECLERVMDMIYEGGFVPAPLPEPTLGGEFNSKRVHAKERKNNNKKWLDCKKSARKGDW